MRACVITQYTFSFCSQIASKALAAVSDTDTTSVSDQVGGRRQEVIWNETKGGQEKNSFSKTEIDLAVVVRYRQGKD